VTSTPPSREPGQGPRITPTRVTTWVVVGGIGVFLLVSGITGILAKG
jgi:hypothetical protein